MAARRAELDVARAAEAREGVGMRTAEVKKEDLDDGKESGTEDVVVAKDKEEKEEDEVSRVKPEVEAAQRKAKEAMRQGDFVKAAALYGELVDFVVDGRRLERLDARERKWTAKLLLRRALAHHQIGSLHQCLDDTDLALKCKPDLQKAFVVQGNVLLALERFSQALECFRRGLQFHPGDEELQEGFDESLFGVRNHRHRYVHKVLQDVRDAAEEKQLERGLRTYTGESHDEQKSASADSVNMSNLLTEHGVCLSLHDLYLQEAAFRRAQNLPVDPTDREVEHAAIIDFFIQVRAPLFITFCSFLTFPNEAPGGGGKLRSGNNVVRALTMGPAQRAVRSDRARASLVPSSTTEHRYWTALGHWARMTEDQFWTFCVEAGMLTETFGEEEFRNVWQVITQDCENQFILFPKFLEGTARLLMKRYRPAEKTVVATPTGKARQSHPPVVSHTVSAVPFSQRLFFLFKKHILSGHIKERPAFERANVFLRELRSNFLRSERMDAIKTAFKARLSRLYEFFTTIPHGKMSFSDVLAMLQQIGYIDRYRHHLREVVCTVVGVNMFVGDNEHQHVSKEELFEILVWCCEARTRDGLIPFEDRFESFLTTHILRPAQERTNIGPMFSV